jgi:hypothetical protein
VTAERPDRPGRRAEHPSLRLRCGHGSWLPREVAAPAAWLPSSGWVRDHGAWSSSSLTLGWAAPEGPLAVPAAIGMRPQRGPSRQRALPARCQQRCDLRRWVVGLPGLEPGTSSLSGFCPRACFPRIAPATCANDLPLETVRDRYEPLGSDGVWTKRGPGRPACGLPARLSLAPSRSTSRCLRVTWLVRAAGARCARPATRPFPTAQKSRLHLVSCAGDSLLKCDRVGGWRGQGDPKRR